MRCWFCVSAALVTIGVAVALISRMSPRSLQQAGARPEGGYVAECCAVIMKEHNEWRHHYLAANVLLAAADRVSNPLSQYMFSLACDHVQAGSALSRSINRRVFELWERTGHCAFADIRSKDIPWRARDIAIRYQEYAKENARDDLRLRREMVSNIELMTTEYWWPALAVIQRCVEIQNPIDVAGELRCVGLLSDGVAVTHRLRQWWEEHDGSLRWDSDQRCFRRPDGGRLALPFVSADLSVSPFP